MLVKRKLGSM